MKLIHRSQKQMDLVRARVWTALKCDKADLDEAVGQLTRRGNFEACVIHRDCTIVVLGAEELSAENAESGD